MDELKRWSREEISRMRNEMDRLFDDLCSDFDLPVMVCRMAGDLDLSEEGDVLVARMELGNMDPEDVQVTVLDRRLVVTAENSRANGYVRSSRRFRKELRLPCLIRTDEVRAIFKEGVLTVRLPKCGENNERKIEISSK